MKSKALFTLPSLKKNPLHNANILKVVAFLGALGAFPSAHADLVAVSISNDAVTGDYFVDMGQGLFTGVGILHEEDAGQVASLNLFMTDELRSGTHSFNAGVGGKFAGVIAENNNGDGASLALGGFASYNLPEMRALSLVGEAYFGPSVTSMNDVEGILWYAFGAEIEVIERAQISFGYRKVQVEVIGGDFDMDEGFNAGIKLEF